MTQIHVGLVLSTAQDVLFTLVIFRCPPRHILVTCRSFTGNVFGEDLRCVALRLDAFSDRVAQANSPETASTIISIDDFVQVERGGASASARLSLNSAFALTTKVHSFKSCNLLFLPKSEIPLLDDSNNIAAIIDWEFTYAALSQFSLDPPWWLVLDAPDMWDDGIDDWVKFYEPRMKTWLSAMQKAEDSVECKKKCMEVPLSTYMRESWGTGRFWLSYAARKSWAFDTLYWKFLYERFFGVRQDGVPRDELWKTRLHLLSEAERIRMEAFVKRRWRI